MPRDRSERDLHPAIPLLQVGETSSVMGLHPVLWRLKGRSITGRLGSGRASQGLRRGSLAHEEEGVKG